MDLIEWAQTYLWGSNSDSTRPEFLAWCKRNGHDEVASAPDAWRLFADWCAEPEPERIYRPAPHKEHRMFVPRIVRPPCENCGAPVARSGAHICMACTFPAEAERRRRQHCLECYPDRQNLP